MKKNNCYILTGGPGSGKSTVLELLKNKDYPCIPESGRTIIIEEKKKNSSALPWKDQELFRDLMFKRDKENFLKTVDGKTYFFDRGIVDSIGYSHLENISISKDLDNAAKTMKYNTTVFAFPPWEEIYEKDTERKQSFETAILTYNNVIKAYMHYGYKVVNVPKDTPENRLEYILRKIGL